MPGQWTLQGSLEKLDAHIKSRGASCIAGTHFLSRRAGGLARLSAAAPLLCRLLCAPVKGNKLVDPLRPLGALKSQQSRRAVLTILVAVRRSRPRFHDHTPLKI